MTSQEQDNPEVMENHPLLWVMDADPLKDAEFAISNKDLRLLAFGGRVVSIPGLDAKRYPVALLRETCGYRILKGISDTLRIGEPTDLRTKAYEYASQYNQQIIQACQLP
jgi:hypothetical protein